MRSRLTQLGTELTDETVAGSDQGPRFFGVATLLDDLIDLLPLQIPRRDFPLRAAGFESLDDLAPVVPAPLAQRPSARSSRSSDAYTVPGTGSIDPNGEPQPISCEDGGQCVEPWIPPR